MSPARFPTLISLAAGKHQLPLIQAAQAQGFKVVAIDRDPGAPGMQLANVALELSTHDQAGIIEALRELAPLFEFKGLVNRTSGKAIETAAHIASEFGLPGLSPTAARIATQKSALREFCLEHGIPMPRGFKTEGHGQLPFGLPVIVKPNFPSVGKLDVRRVAKPEELQPALRAAAGSSMDQLVEVEQYIDGIDVSCLFWLEDQAATPIVTYDELIGVAQDGTLLPFGIAAPSSCEPSARPTQRHGEPHAGIRSVLDGLASALPGVRALMIVSLRLDGEGQPHVIELHADLGGDRIAEELFPRALPKLDYFDLAVRMACGEALPDLGTGQGSHMLLYDGGEASLGDPAASPCVLSADCLEENLEHLAESVLRCSQEVALPPRQLTNWARSLGGAA